jgi:hypothetical protein
MTEWQPIETAPKDGTNILVANAEGWVGQVFWQNRWYNENHAGWMIANCDEEYGEYITATHWMPLPEPPHEGDKE